MKDDQIEQEIQAKGLTAPRVTPADLEAKIDSEHYFTAAEGASALVNIGAGVSNLVVAAGGTPEFTRVVNLGYDALVQALETERTLFVIPSILLALGSLAGEKAEAAINWSNSAQRLMRRKMLAARWKMPAEITKTIK